VWCLLSSCKTVRTLWAELGDDKVATHYRGVVRASVLRRMDRQPTLRRPSWSHVTVWSDDTEYIAAGRGDCHTGGYQLIVRFSFRS
jgi:hypothetical protein